MENGYVSHLIDFKISQVARVEIPDGEIHPSTGLCGTEVKILRVFLGSYFQVDVAKNDEELDPRHKMFLKKHVCGEMCKQMGLAAIPMTAARRDVNLILGLE